MSSAADTANDPIYSKLGGCYVTELSNIPRLQDQSAASYKGEAEGKQSSGSFATSENSPTGSDTTCPMCRKLHDLDEYKTFMAKSIDDRRAFLKENRMCFSCYGLFFPKAVRRSGNA